MSEFPIDTYFYIKNKKTNTVLDVYDGATTEGAHIIMWPQASGKKKGSLPETISYRGVLYRTKMNDNDNQLWRCEDGYLINMKSKLVLDVRGGDLKADTLIVQYGRKTTAAQNQRFGFRDGYLYVLADPQLVFDIKGKSNKDGAKLILNQRTNQDNEYQQWMFEPFTAPEYNNTFG
ncbi:ricin B lectin domain-containing protein [Absidia repens]|uniref:Ricin B lectin domain-containing protein n=1 Tax=Absidia repens TaxID=90262 RepID=A0A1X2HR11_9FUNG|nr:ricin B lectin domain-containing protein [Absidia repens]